MRDDRYARLAAWKQREIDRMVGALALVSARLADSQHLVTGLTDEIGRERARDVAGLDGVRQDWIRHRRADLSRLLAQMDRLHREAQRLRKAMIDAQGELDGLKEHIHRAARHQRMVAARAEQAGADEAAIAAHWRGTIGS